MHLEIYVVLFIYITNRNGFHKILYVYLSEIFIWPIIYCIKYQHINYNIHLEIYVVLFMYITNRSGFHEIVYVYL